MREIVPTPTGPAWVELDTPLDPPIALLLLGHGAGGTVDAPDLLAVRAAALAAGCTVARITQPYRVAGRRAPAPAARLDEAWLAVVGHLVRRPELAALPRVVAGRSSGARVACRTATAVGALGVIALAFPWHPPGKPDRTRADELARLQAPVLVVQGDRDPFGRPVIAPGRTVAIIAGADHSLKQDPAAVGALVVEFVTTLVGRARIHP